jgi:hypothetical protein
MAYFDGRDYRGMLIAVALLAFVGAWVFHLQTLDLPAGLKIGRHVLVESQHGDPAYALPRAIALGCGLGAAALASIRRLWER